MTTELLTGAEPFFFPGGPHGCLLIHGFTGTPFEMRGLGQYLAARSYTVFGPRLSHHGSKPADMNRSRWHDWYLAALDGWYLLLGQCNRVVVIGLSMGGATALLLAANQPVATVITMNTPLKKLDWRQSCAGYLWPLISNVAKPKKSPTAPEVPNYPVYPLRAVAELDKLLGVVEEALPKISAPALLMHSRHDESIPPQNLEAIYDQIGSTAKEKIWIERGGHIMTEDIDKEIVYKHIGQFLETNLYHSP